jgi:hypothetical protein
MEKITRKINYKTTECVVYTTDDCPHPMVYWKSAAKGDWATTDDGYVAECIAKNIYTDKSGRVKTLIKLTCGLQWNTGNSKLLYKPNKEAGIYSMIKPRAWQDRESKKKRTKNAVNAYVSQIVEGKKIDWQQIGNIYRADQKKPEATVKRLFREKVITNMVEEKLKEILSSRGIDKGYVLDTILKAISIAEDKQDVSNMLRGVENFVDMLEMKPSKKVTTDTLQIDMTNQIMDNIETEEKKLVASRKVESDVVEYHDPGDEND